MIRVSNIRVSVDIGRHIDLTGIHQAMSQRYKQIVLSSFGPNGSNRESPWRPLNPKYAKRVNPPVPTLKREQARIYNSIKASWDSRSGHVTCDSDIGAYHQYGLGRNPRRPFFPFDRSGKPTDFAQKSMEKTVKEYFVR